MTPDQALRANILAAEEDIPRRQRRRQENLGRKRRGLPGWAIMGIRIAVMALLAAGLRAALNTPEGTQAVHDVALLMVEHMGPILEDIQPLVLPDGAVPQTADLTDADMAATAADATVAEPVIDPRASMPDNRVPVLTLGR